MPGGSNLSYVFSENTEPRRILSLAADDHEVAKATLGDQCVGVSHEGTREAPIPSVSTALAALAGESARVYGPTETCEIDVGSTAISHGDRIAPDANSKAQPAIHGFPYVGWAQADGAANGKVRAYIMPGDRENKQNTILAKTADYTVTIFDLGKTFTNTGASGAVTFALPAAIPGYEVFARVDAAQQLRLDPNGTEQICLPSTGVPGAAGKYLVADAVNETLHLRCNEAGIWDVVSYTGTWTAEA